MRRRSTDTKPLQLKPGVWARGQTRILLAVWLLLLLPPLSLTAGLFVLSRQGADHVLSSGDPLLDAFLAELRSEESFAADEYSAYLISLSPAAWQRLESRFAEDPRLYELRGFVNVGMRTAFGHAQAEEGYDSYAAASGKQLRSAALTSQQLNRKLVEYQYEAQQRLGLERPRRGAGPPEWKQYFGALRAESKRLHGTELDTLFAELQELAPQEATIWYDRALQLTLDGDFDAARQAFITGNSKPDCAGLHAFPLNYYYARIAEGNPPADKLLGSLFARCEVSQGSANALALRRGTEIYTAEAMQRGELDALRAMQLALVRWCGAPGTMPTESYVLSRGLDSSCQAAAAASMKCPSADASALKGQLSSSLRQSIAGSVGLAHQASATAPGLRGMISLFAQHLGHNYAYPAALYDDSLAWRQKMAPDGSIGQLLLRIEKQLESTSDERVTAADGI